MAIGVGVAGAILAAVGFILFISVFFEGIGLFTESWGRIRTDGVELRMPGTSRLGDALAVPNFAKAFIGVVLTGIGAMMVRGALGMGLIVNAKPLARWAGSVMGEATRSRGASTAPGTHIPQTSTVIKVRCSSCSSLNSEYAKFCNQCGAALG